MKFSSSSNFVAGSFVSHKWAMPAGTLSCRIQLSKYKELSVYQLPMSVILVYSNRCREYTSCGRATTLRTLLCVLTTQLCVVCFALVSLWHFPCRWTMRTTSTPGTRRTTTRRRTTRTRTRRNKNTERIKREGWGIYKRKDFQTNTCEKLKHRTNILMQFLSSCHAVFTFLYPLCHITC